MHHIKVLAEPLVFAGLPRMAQRFRVPLADVLRTAIFRVAPVGLVVGAAMEAFMNVTGFYEVAKRNEREKLQNNERHLVASTPGKLS